MLFTNLYFIFDAMKEAEAYQHFEKKLYERLHLKYRHFIPLGKPLPESYRDMSFQLFKIFDSGVLEDMTQEPILEDEVKQLDMLTMFFSANASDNGDGTDVDNTSEKTP